MAYPEPTRGRGNKHAGDPAETADFNDRRLQQARALRRSRERVLAALANGKDLDSIYEEARKVHQIEEYEKAQIAKIAERW